MTNIGNTIYSGVSTVGRTWALVVAIIVTFISTIFIILGIVLLVKKSKYKNKITGTIIDNVKCIPTYHDNNGVQSTTFNCLNINVEYYIDNKKYINKINISSNNEHKKNGKIEFYYNPDDPNDINYLSDSYKSLGIILLTIFIIILLIVWINYWLTKKYKFLAATEGITDIYNFIN